MNRSTATKEKEKGVLGENVQIKRFGETISKSVA